MRVFLGVARCFLVFAGYCSVCFESFALHHYFGDCTHLRHQETTTKEENLKPAKERFKSQNKF